MPTYRIKKGKRVFKAERLETLEELAGQGLLESDDLVSVDGGAFLPASELDALQEPLTEALLAKLETEGDVAPEVPAERSGGADGVLEAFLSEVSDAEVGATSGRVPVAPPVGPPSVGSTPVVGRLEREEPEPLLRVEPLLPEAIPELVGESIEALEVEDLPSVDPARSLRSVPVVPPVGEDSGVVADPAFLEAQRKIGAMAAGAGAPTAPLSFADWVTKRGTSEGGALLENFGHDDTLVALNQARQVEKEFSFARVLLLVALGGFLVGSYYLWVRTGATQQFPRESDLIVERAPAPPAADSEATPLAPPGSLDARLRSRVGNDVIDFGNPDELKNAIFIELQNLGCRPLEVDVEVLAAKSARGRPTEVGLRIRQAGVSGDTKEQLAQIQERLGLTWMLVGKYGQRGRVTARSVSVQIEGSSIWKRDGARLVALYKGATTSSDIFLRE